MNSGVKVLIVLLCLAVCGLGAIAASMHRDAEHPLKVNVTPVKNEAAPRRIWTQV